MRQLSPVPESSFQDRAGNAPREIRNIDQSRSQSGRRYPPAFHSSEEERSLSRVQSEEQFHSFRTARSSSSLSSRQLSNGRLVLESNDPSGPSAEINTTTASGRTLAVRSSRIAVASSSQTNTRTTDRTRTTNSAQSSHTSTMSEQPLLQSAPGNPQSHVFLVASTKCILRQAHCAPHTS